MLAIKNMEFLVFHLHGPMASFGEIAVGEYRPSSAHPTKSAIMGLVAAALGIQRGDEEGQAELFRNFGYGVFVLHEGVLLRDYHTIQTPTASSLKKQPAFTRRDELNREQAAIKTILSSRDYRQGAWYRVVLWKRSGSMELAKLRDSLEKPKYTLYLGRKSCPLAIPLEPKICEAQGAVEALRTASHSLDAELEKVFTGWSPKKTIRGRIYLDEDGALEDLPARKIRRWDEPISRKRWQFRERTEIALLKGVEMEQTDVS